MNGSALIALGTNLPHRGVSGPALLAQAVTALRAAGVTPRQFSGIWETDPWPPGPETRDQPSFYNAVLEVDPAGRTPQALYGALREIEIAFGRERRERWGPRTLDLDILAMEGWAGVFHGDLGDLSVPHPGMAGRAFVLAPLAEVAPAWVHPSLGLQPGAMLALVPDRRGVRRWGDFPTVG